MPDDAGYAITDPDDDPPAKKGRKPRRRDTLVRLLANVDLWRSPDGIAHASVPVDGHAHYEHVRVASRDFRQWLTLAYFRAEERGLSGQSSAEMVALAEARALASGIVRRPWRRVALGDDGATIYLDLGGGDPSGERRAVEITPSGWSIVEAEDVPTAFLRAGDALPLPEPMAEEATTETIRRFVNVLGDDDLALVWAWIVCSLRPFSSGGAYPLAAVHGEQGTGKSLATRFLQGIVDPSSVNGRAQPREERDLFVSAANRHILALDNISAISEGFADSFCRIATGGGFSARALHTDADESILSALKPILLNGIPSSIIARPDLASRALSLELGRLSVRRSEKELIADYVRALPGLLGLACDGLCSALRNFAQTTLAEDIRMIDAATWAEASAEGLGIPPGRISAAWVANRTAADRALVESDDLALAIVALLDAELLATDRAEWRGTPADLYRKLCEHVLETTKRSPQWPRTASGMGTRLRRLAPPLRVVHGIDAAHGKGGADNVRYWVLRRL